MPNAEPPSPVSPQESIHSPNHSQNHNPISQSPPTGTQSNPISRPSRNNTQTSALSSSTAPISPTARSSEPAVANPAVPATPSAANAESQRPLLNEEQGRRRSSQRPKTLFERFHSSFSPSTHDLKEFDDVPVDTVRPYLHKQQRSRLQLKSWTEWFITVILCLAYFLVLYFYDRDKAIDRRHRRIINSLVTGIVLLLGVNLNNSLRSYAKMIRWRFLASGYRSLKEFDLLMGCDSIMNVVSLVSHGRHKDKKFPFNSKVQFYALAWLIVQLGIVLAIGVIGLTYNLDISPNFVNVQTGNTSSVDLASLSTGNYLYDLSGLQLWGIRGSALQPAPYATLDQQNAQDGSYLTDYSGHSRRFFVDYNPDNYRISAISSRYIESSVICTQYRVTDGEYGSGSFFTYDVDGRAVNQTLFAAPGPSGLYVTADGNSTGCGPRCTQVVLFQAQSPDDSLLDAVYIDHALRFACNVSVSNIEDLYGGLGDIYEISPLLSKMLGGMLAWSSNAPNGTEEYQLYQETSQVGWYTVPTQIEVADFVSQWTIAGVAAMDARDGSTTESGLTRMYVGNGNQPIQAQKLSVKWWATGAILGAIPFVHFWTLILVIFFANKVIIKDDNPIAVAKVYHTLLNKIGDHHGCMLTGNQLIEALEDDHHVSKVIFGTKDEVHGMKHVDIYEEGSGVNPPRVFPEGDYDGVGTGNHPRRRQKRTLDAHDYF